MSVLLFIVQSTTGRFFLSLRKKGGVDIQIKFTGSDHQEFFNWIVTKDGCGKDSYRLALFYLIGVCETMRLNYKDIYDIEEHVANVKSLNSGWQTGTSVRLTRLGLNLYNGWYGFDYETQKQIDPAEMYSPYELFCHELAEYALIAVGLRYERYIILTLNE